MIVGFQPGSVLEQDALGNIIDKTATLYERAVELGMVWRLGNGYTTLANSGDKIFVSFKTPAAGPTMYYGYVRVAKSGYELVWNLNEGGTFTGGTALTPVNLNRQSTNVCKLTAVKVGLSTVDGALANGTDLPLQMLGGSEPGGSASQGGSQTSEPHIKLKPNTTYTVVFQAKGAVSVVFNIDMVQYE